MNGLMNNPGMLFWLQSLVLILLLLYLLYLRRQTQSQQDNSFEAAYHELVQSIPLGVYVMWTNPRGEMRFEYVSPLLQSMLQVPFETYRDEPHKVFAAVHPDERDAFILRNLECQARSAPFHWEGRFELDGRQHWLRMQSVPTRKHNQQIRWLGVVEDITERKTAENQLVEAIAKAESAAQAKSTLIANISHEVRTPMNGILGLTHLCLQTPVTDQQRDYLKKIDQSGQNLLHLLNDLLDLSRLDAGCTQLEAKGFSLQALLAQIESLFAAQAERKQLRFSIHLEQGVPQWLEGDVQRIGQILNNLVDNAIKFTTRGQVSMEVSSGDMQQDKIQLSFRVRDTGPGIASCDQAWVFQPFYQGGNNHRELRGSGLGLAISRELAQAMGGELRLHEGGGTGCCFELRLNLKVVDAETTPLGDLSESHYETIAPLARCYRILVVEDHPLNRQVVQEQLVLAGCEVVLAANGREALDCLAQTSVDLVLMDLQMPEMDGYETVRRIRQDPRWQDLPVLAMTAITGPEQESLSLAAGMNAHLTKPVRPKDLIQWIEGCFEASSQPEADKVSHLETLGSHLPEEKFKALIESMAMDCEARLQRLEALAQDPDWDALRREVHDLIGTSNNAGLKTLAALGQALRQAVHAQDSVALEAQMQKLKAVGQEALETLKAWTR